MKNNPQILIIRPDALGDVILTFPLLVQIKENFPNSTISYLAAPYTSEILKEHPLVDNILCDMTAKGKHWHKMPELVKELKRFKFDIVIHCYNEVYFGIACRIAGIPERIGDSSKLITRLFLNRRVKQDFRNWFSHEVELNLKLLEGMCITQNNSVRFGLNKSSLLDFNKIISELKIAIKPNHFLILHPGLGNGNRSLPSTFYSELITSLSKQGYVIILTGSMTERSNSKLNLENLDNVFDIRGKTNLIQLKTILSFAACLISVDTGPMHLAAAVGISVVLISPTKYVKPTRWGPYGVRSIISSPLQYCHYRCFPYPCKYDDCILNFSPTTVINDINKLLNFNHLQPEPFRNGWLKHSLHIYDRRKNPEKIVEISEYSIFDKPKAYTFINFLISFDINVVIVDKVRLLDKIISSFTGLYLYYPTKFFTANDLTTLLSAYK